ncbi:hypothetical protein B0O99DRAFT_688537 [Bisporella sp. PMI_857]|nr:hypothetical protein B0O99DRAFT_688537 [Bisporella sp. PMI_857]
MVSCHQMWSHPLHTIHVAKKCSNCERKVRATANTLGKISDVLTSMHETMDRLAGGPRQSPVSGVEISPGRWSQDESDSMDAGKTESERVSFRDGVMGVLSPRDHEVA